MQDKPLSMASRWAERRPVLVDVTSVADTDDENHTPVLYNGVDDTVVSDTDAKEGNLGSEPLGAGRIGFFRELLHLVDKPGQNLPGNFAELPLRRRFEDDAIGHLRAPVPS